MAVLLTGGAGAKTAQRIASLCDEVKIPYLYASRSAPESPSASNPPAVRFDWVKQETWGAPFEYAFPGGETIRAVYIIMPRVPEPEKHINAFIDFAVTKGAKRFVLMAGTTAQKGREGPGKVWEHMVEKGVEWAVCRPTWFMENLVEETYHLKTVREEGKIYTAIGDERVPFVSAVDIGAVAFVALTSPEAPNTDYRIVGPENLTHDEVAAKLSKKLGRDIQHVKMTPEERVNHLKTSLGLNDHHANYMVWLEKQAAEGLENHSNDVVERITGQKPVSLESFVEQHHELMG
ncbi:nucleoside-diphosphate-sugar epimerase family protein [Podospora didyma]|uniref:Nucleoside-diphosphate-sugar epimerase family protein n=1 Tax=Podospora didyma TaxID=330526 RepID=A0AAE0N2R8_9PEZI|nr:nucleoside-diphosphate-sugar epimerase family protein [Podospora didyma]